MNLKDKRIVVTGGAGFVGSHLVDSLIERKPKEIIILSNFFLGNLANLKEAYKKFDFHVNIIDLSDRVQVLQFFEMRDWTKETIDIVFNLAVVPLPTSLVKPEWTFRQNVDMTLNLCEGQRLGYFKTLIQFSSSEAYGNTLISSMREDHPVNPTTPYGASKLATDHIVLSYCKTFGIDASVIRPFNCYGPRQNAKEFAGIIPIVINKVLNKEPIFINGDGLQTRDLTYVTDVAEVAISVLECKETRGQIVNIGSGQEISINDLVGMITKKMGYTGEIIRREARRGEVQRLIADISLAKKLFNYAPKIDLETGLDKTIQWYKDNRNGG
jgi:UDP-glucose 4-epimerase